MSHTTVAKMVKAQAKEVKAMNKEVISRLMKKGYRFSVTLDEYTRIGNRKLMNVNLHAPDGDFLQIGMIRVRGKMPAEVAKEVLTKKLTEYGVGIEKDVVSHTTDGASVCIKMGKLLKIPHQVCLAHALHLAVCDVLYKAAKKSNQTDDSEDEDEDEDNEEDEVTSDWLAEAAEEEPELIVCVDAINKVRKLVRKFRRSTNANDALLAKVEEIIGKEKTLQIDVK